RLAIRRSFPLLLSRPLRRQPRRSPDRRMLPLPVANNQHGAGHNKRAGSQQGSGPFLSLALTNRHSRSPTTTLIDQGRCRQITKRSIAANAHYLKTSWLSVPSRISSFYRRIEGI